MHRFYHSPGACSLAVHIILEEIGEPYETDLRSARQGEGTTTQDYLALNPKGRIPALGGVAGASGGAPGLLTEALAILTYLARSHPEARLLGRDAADEARCLEWLGWLSVDLHGIAYGQLWRAHRYADDPRLHDAIRAKGQANILAAHDHIERWLGDGRNWAVPGGFTVADAYLMVFWLWGLRTGLDMARRWPCWASLMARVGDRPAVRRAFAQEGIELAG